MKLKIGNVAEKKKETVDGELTNYFDTLSDEEIEAIQDDVNGVDLGELENKEEEKKKFVMGLANNTEELKEEKEEIDTTEADEKAEAEEAVNGINIINDVGINPKSVLNFNKLFPNKKVVYRNLITKQFIYWYINIARFSWLKKLNIDSEHINPNQKKGIIKMLAIRTKKEDTPELKDVGSLAEPKLIEVEKEEEFSLETDEEIDMYNFLLSEKWDKKDTMRIIELNDLIYEQMRVNRTNVLESLETLIKTFKLKFEKKDAIQRELDEEHSLLEKPEKKEKKEKKYTTAKDIAKSIKYYRHIKFLYKLMSDKMDFNKTPTKKDKEQITEINELLFGHIDEKEKKDDNGHQSTEMTVFDFIEKEDS